MRIQAKLSLFAVLLACALVPFLAYADSSSNLTVKPAVLDEKAKVQDIINETITISNTGSRKFDLYPSINDVQNENGTQNFTHAENSQELKASMANWVELSRGVIEIAPGEEKKIPIVIHVPRAADAGSYHAIITFTEGATRDQADSRPPLGSLTLNVDVQADIKELLQLNSFATDNMVFAGDDVLFKYQVQNIGNQTLNPKGEIRVYDRKGLEVASVDVNAQGKTITPDQKTQLASVWGAAQGFGKYKAVINVDYGTSQVASVQDVVYFWVIPWKQLLALTVMTLVAFIILALSFYRALEERHFGKLAAAGLIKEEAIEQEHLPVLTQVEPEEPQASPVSLLSRVAETVQEKKSQFFAFRRRGFAATDAALRPIATVEVPVPVARPQVTQVAGTAIDLKRMIPTPPKETADPGHVINLKF